MNPEIELIRIVRYSAPGTSSFSWTSLINIKFVKPKQTAYMTERHASFIFRLKLRPPSVTAVTIISKKEQSKAESRGEMNQLATILST